MLFILKMDQNMKNVYKMFENSYESNHGIIFFISASLSLMSMMTCEFL